MSAATSNSRGSREAKAAFARWISWCTRWLSPIRAELEGAYYNTSRAGFHMAMDISVYSFTAIARHFEPVLCPGGSLLTLTYYGSEKVAPNYNVMGVRKPLWKPRCATWLMNFGTRHIRVNAISAGPIRTLASAGVGGSKRCTVTLTAWHPCSRTSPSKM